MKDMLKRNEGSVVFISSEAAIRSIGNMVPYSVTKTAILGLGRSWPRPRNRRSARKCERPSRPSTACSRIPAAKDLSGNILKTEGATTEVVAKDLGIDRTTAFRRLRVVERKGLVVNLEPRPNPRPSYWRTVPGSKLDEALGDFLPSTATLQDEFDDYLRRGGKERK